jgi:FixJ family two-component response regulator
MKSNLPSPRVLIADDQADVREALRLLVKGEGYQCQTVSSPDGVMQALGEHEFDLVLIDLNYARDTTSGEEGLDLLGRIRTLDPTMPVVVMTAWGTVDLAVASMRRGACDFVTKPWENDRLAAILRNQIALGRAWRTERRLEAENELLREDRPGLDRGIPDDAACAPAGRARGTGGCQRVVAGRERDRQRPDRPPAARRFGASQSFVRGCEYGWLRGEPLRK